MPAILIPLLLLATGAGVTAAILLSREDEIPEPEKPKAEPAVSPAPRLFFIPVPTAARAVAPTPTVAPPPPEVKLIKPAQPVPPEVTTALKQEKMIPIFDALNFDRKAVSAIGNATKMLKDANIPFVLKGGNLIDPKVLLVPEGSLQRAKAVTDPLLESMREEFVSTGMIGGPVKRTAESKFQEEGIQFRAVVVIPAGRQGSGTFKFSVKRKNLARAIEIIRWLTQATR